METDRVEEQGLCTWVDFTLTDIERLQEYSLDMQGLRKAMGEKLGLLVLGSQVTKQQLIELDLYVYAFLFGVKRRFTSAQLSTLLSTVKKLHEMCIGTVFDNYAEVFGFFQELMVRHSVNRPPFSVCIFSPNEVKSISTYFLSTYFKHFKLYKYAFTRKAHLNMSLTYDGEDETVPEARSDQNAQVERTLEYGTEQQDDRDRSSESSGGELFNTKQTESAKLRELINRGLITIVQQEQDRVQMQLAAQETKLLNKISALEAIVDANRPTTNSGKKKGKTAH